MMWKIGQDALSAKLHDTKTGAVADRPGGCAAIQRDIQKAEEMGQQKPPAVQQKETSNPGDK